METFKYLYLLALFVATMYVDDLTYTVQGRTYRRVLLRTSYRDNGKVKHKTIANLSKCPDEEIEAIKLALKYKGSIVESAATAENIVPQLGLSVGAVYVLSKLAYELGISRALGESREARLALWLIIARIINQGSRLSAVRLAQQHAACDVLGLDSFNEDDLYKTLDWLCSNQSKIEKKLYRQKYRNNRPKLFLYDVTSTYLEGVSNELAAYGYNRDKKRGKLQIVIGLLTDEDGDPISIEAFEGNTQDPQTVHNQIKKLANRFNCEEVTFVGDRGMIKSMQIEELNSQQFHYITAITKPQIETLLKQRIIQMELFTENLCEVVDGDIRYILKRNPQRAKEIRANRQDKVDKIQALISDKNTYLNEHPRAKIDVAVRDIDTLINHLKISEFASVLNQGRELFLKIDNKKRIAMEQLDGCYIIKTDLSTDVFDTESVHKTYKNLKFVEQAFETMKTDFLEVRPVYLQKESRTRGHLVEVMLAYKITKYLREKWSGLNLRVEEGIHQLSMICATIFQVGPIIVNKIPRPQAIGLSLLNALGIVIPEVLPHREVKLDTRKQLNHRIKNG